MEDIYITASLVEHFHQDLQEKEKSVATIEKYLRDIKKLMIWLQGRAVSKKLMLEYKEQIGRDYAVTSANSMLASIQKKTYHCGSFDTLEEAVQARKAAEEVIVQGTLRHWEKWKKRADADPAWGVQHPIEIRVEKNRAGQFHVSFLPEME